MAKPLFAESVSNVFTREVAAPRLARRWADPVLARWGLDGTMPDAAVAVSELMTNAVVHGAGDIRLTLVKLEGGVRIEVSDRGSGKVTRVPLRSDAPGGRGVHIVAQIARAWGVEPDPAGGKTVWAEFDVNR